MRCAEASERKRVVNQTRRRVDETDFLNSASEGSGSPKGMVMNAIRVVKVRQTKLINTGNKATHNRSNRYRDDQRTTDKQ